MFLTVFTADCIIFGFEITNKIYDISMFILLQAGISLNVGAAWVQREK
jgi:hypothetical protein